MKIVTVSEMQKAERDCAQFGISTDMLMENAGEAVAKKVREIYGNLPQQNVLILIGPGNNGGDGLVAGRNLYDWGTGRVKIYLCSRRPENDVHMEELKKRSIHFRELTDDNNYSKLNEWLSEATVVLDSIFGTGKIRPLSGPYAEVLDYVKMAKKQRPDLHIVALDLPSGLNADTGYVDLATLQADETVSLGFPKTGLYNLPGSSKAGRISIVDIGIPGQVVDYVNKELLTDTLIKALLPVRPLVSHKGTYGKVLAFTGSTNYLGAAYLACTGAIRGGAGLATLAIARSLQPVLATKLTEVTYLPLPDLLTKFR
jgi:NAD(P)H-hydrate epimerase